MGIVERERLSTSGYDVPSACDGSYAFDCLSACDGLSAQVLLGLGVKYPLQHHVL